MIVCYCCARSGMPAALRAMEDGGLDDVLLREVPCTGAVESWEVLRSFRQGADGVLLVGCLLENCAHHYGSEVASRRAARLSQVMSDIGSVPGKVAMVHLAEHQADRFRRAVEGVRKANGQEEGR
ncbi:MAG TPA: hydrogenase iron-sulfur subunit [Methanomassiliicoccales archaeon]|nr:hydrogenase iron-sulfur subunit [Methanomassiliicoccales archaeon]HRU11979.1 hydrogenase iron-sulfur subunit [Methanomassiliicoccales archaeon]